MADIDPQVEGSTGSQPSRSGAEAIVEALHASGVEMVFGYPGGGTGAIIHQIATTGLANMNGRTELAGAWMSYGYNRIKGRAALARWSRWRGRLPEAAAGRNADVPAQGNSAAGMRATIVAVRPARYPEPIRRSKSFGLGSITASRAASLAVRRAAAFRK